MITAFFRRLALLACVLPSLVIATPAAADNADWATASDTVRTVLVASAIGVPIVDGDWQGAEQASLSMGSALLATVALKETFPSIRPDGNGNDSFPSGHTSISFAAAATLTQRRGLAIGIPAHIAAAFVGVARVQANRHRWGDVIVGAVIGEAAGQLLTSRRPSRVAVIPWGDLSGGGITIAARF
jgi:membrane-associated phospholipid phosphatase